MIAAKDWNELMELLTDWIANNAVDAGRTCLEEHGFVKDAPYLLEDAVNEFQEQFSFEIMRRLMNRVPSVERAVME